MKRTVLLLTLLLVIGAGLFFYFCGGMIRDHFSPEVYRTSVSYEVYDGVMCVKLPKEALFRNSDGGTCVYAIETTDKLPEKSYVVREIAVEAAEKGDMIYIAAQSLGNVNQVVIKSDKALVNGSRVRIAGKM